MTARESVYAGLERNYFEFWAQPVITDEDTGELSCPGFTGPTYSNNPWDVVTIGGDRTPGIAQVMCEKRRAIDRKKPAGADGARITVHGADLAEVQIQLLIWTPQQLAVLNALWARWMPPSGKSKPQQTKASGQKNAPKAIDPSPFIVSHPKFITHDVTAIQIIGGRGPDDGPVPRSKVFTILAVEFRSPSTGASKTNTPVAAIGSTLDEGIVDHPLAGENPDNTGPE